MTGFQRDFQDAAFVDRYSQQGPPAFMPGHAGVLQMTGVLLREGAPADARVLVVGAGGGLETRALAMAHPAFRFVGVDPAPQMIELARRVVGAELGERVDLRPGAPFVLVDQCPDRSAPDVERGFDRYAACARASGVDAEIVDRARAQLRSNPGLVPPERNASLLVESGFHDREAFYVGMAWRGWLASA